MSELWDPLLLSLRIAGAATALCVLCAVPLALFMTRRRFWGKSLIDALIIVPMVMPPTVVGYALIRLLGIRGWAGQWLARVFHFRIMFSFKGAVLAAAVVAMPMLYLPAKAGFAAVERDLEDSARLMGANRWQVFWHVSLPLARRGIYSGLLLAFARALGEFGATMMILGWQAKKLTLPIALYSHWMAGELPEATVAMVALGAVALALTLAYNRSTAGNQE